MLSKLHQIEENLLPPPDAGYIGDIDDVEEVYQRQDATAIKSH